MIRKLAGGKNHSSAGLKTSRGLSGRQLRAIWALAARLGFSEGELHARIASTTGKRSIKLLKKEEAQAIIHDLFAMITEDAIKVDPGSNRPIGGTKEQSDLIRTLCRQIGWNLWQAEGLAKKMYGVPGLKEIDVKQASGLIEALKAIRSRHAA